MSMYQNFVSIASHLDEVSLKPHVHKIATFFKNGGAMSFSTLKNPEGKVPFKQFYKRMTTDKVTKQFSDTDRYIMMFSATNLKDVNLTNLEQLYTTEYAKTPRNEFVKKIKQKLDMKVMSLSSRFKVTPRKEKKVEQE